LSCWLSCRLINSVRAPGVGNREGESWSLAVRVEPERKLSYEVLPGSFHMHKELR